MHTTKPAAISRSLLFTILSPDQLLQRFSPNKNTWLQKQTSAP
jgi:hypothetical protein